MEIVATRRAEEEVICCFGLEFSWLFMLSFCCSYSCNFDHQEDLVQQGELSVTVGQQGDVMRKKANGSIIINQL